MSLFNSVIKFFLTNRLMEIERFMENPAEVQHLVFKDLIQKSKATEWGKQYGYGYDMNEISFQNKVPISTYENLYPYIERMLKGEQNILWHSKIDWFSKSSGTTNDRSKFIPVSYEAIEECHNKCGKDMLCLMINNFNTDTLVFEGKSLAIGGTHHPNPFNPETRVGDVSAIIVQNLPLWAEYSRAPSREIAFLPNWEEKIRLMVETLVDENITSLSGVPTWMIVVLHAILEKTGKKNLLEVWPNLEIFLHGAVSFGPYKEIFRQLIPSDKFAYLELYNASEGFFGIQDIKGADDMLLMLDHGIFYEFIPMEHIDSEHPKALTIDQVELDKNYAIVISTNSGLWRYKIGDTIKFTSKKPYRIKITGRTKSFINAFGEEVVVENADKAVQKACEATNATLKDYTAGPIYMASKNKGGHEWIIEFEEKPDSKAQFIQVLDNTLREINSDYDAKRYKDMALGMPVVHFVKEGTFYNWLKSKNKLGGQHKVPRLANNRTYIEEILAIKTP
ncbi:MAG: GH3 auxin-responsive promoter family protein [Bacteroidota bacterium]|nr:GH3 auxin-responsive promoter family protein [Bacteroidota bacterium]